MKLSIDFTNVSDGGKFNVPVGEYVAKIKSVTQESGQSGYDYLKWTLIIASGGAKGNEITHITTLKPDGLFALRNFLTACGVNVPNTVVNIDPAKLINKPVGIVVGEREYNGKMYPKVNNVKPANEVNLPTSKPTPVEDDEDDVLSPSVSAVGLDELDD